MNKKVFIAALLVLFLAAILIWMRSVQSSDRKSSAETNTTTTAKPRMEDLKQSNTVARTAPDEYPQLSLKQQTAQKAVLLYVERIRTDSKADWKIPIRFYGQVLDQYEKPVAEASVQFEWTDLSADGSSEKTTITDAQGRFSLTGVKGKTLGIRISKDGYYNASHKENQTSFEYANPAEKWFYEPDETRPVVFHLRKKGEAEPLLKRSVEFRLPGDGTGQALDLLAGKVTAAGPLQIKTWKPPYSPEPRPAPYDWRITVEIPDGGFVENQDIYPFTAPDSGYVASIDLHMSLELGQQWRSYIDKTFYFCYGQPRRYGRMQLRTDGDRQIVFVDYFLNPTPGSRNLEFDPQKTIKP